MGIRDYLKTQDNIMEVEQGEIDNYLSDLQELFFEFINSYVDLDALNEEQMDILDEILEKTEDDNESDEVIEDEIHEVAGKRKRVVRGGKRKKKIDCPAGYKAVGGKKCVRMSAQEKKTRKRAQKKGARKRRTGQNQATRKRQRSMRRRL